MKAGFIKSYWLKLSTALRTGRGIQTAALLNLVVPFAF